MITILLLGLVVVLALAFRTCGLRYALGLFALIVIVLVVVFLIVSLRPELIRVWLVPVV